MRDLASARLRGGALVAVTGAAQTHQARDLLQQLLRGAELLRVARGSRHAAELPWIGPGQPPDRPNRGTYFRTACSTALSSSLCTWAEPKLGPRGARSDRCRSCSIGAYRRSASVRKPSRS